MKTKRSFLIYNESIGYVGFKCYTYLRGAYEVTYIACNLIDQ